MENRTLGFGLIAGGALLLAVRAFGTFEIPAMELLWPLFVIVPGVALLYGAYVINKNDVRLAVPGAIVTTTGLILATFNTFGHWEAWSYAWALYPVVVGATLSYIGWHEDNAKLQRTGRTALTAGIYLFGGFAFFFEGIIFSGNTGWLDSLLWPVLLIAGGSALVLIQRPDHGKGKRKPKNESAYI